MYLWLTEAGADRPDHRVDEVCDDALLVRVTDTPPHGRGRGRPFLPGERRPLHH